MKQLTVVIFLQFIEKDLLHRFLAELVINLLHFWTISKCFFRIHRIVIYMLTLEKVLLPQLSDSLVI